MILNENVKGAELCCFAKKSLVPAVIAVTAQNWKTTKFYASSMESLLLPIAAENSFMIPVSESPQNQKHSIFQNITMRISSCNI